MDNHTIAQQLMRQARYLGDQHASLYRARAYRRAAEIVLGLDKPIEDMLAQRGRRGLQELPGIGAHIAQTLETLVRTGMLPTLNQDKPKHVPERGKPWGSDQAREQSCNDFSTSCP
jgi:DNA polymerase/3'-5' exonuclease PolX